MRDELQHDGGTDGEISLIENPDPYLPRKVEDVGLHGNKIFIPRLENGYAGVKPLRQDTREFFKSCLQYIQKRVARISVLTLY